MKFTAILVALAALSTPGLAVEKKHAAVVKKSLEHAAVVKKSLRANGPEQLNGW